MRTALKEWAPLVGSLVGALLAFLAAAGFGLVTPATTSAAMQRRLDKIEQEHRGLAAVQRFLCYLDREKGELAGIPGCYAPGNNLPGR